MKKLKKWLRIFLIFCVFILLFVVISNIWVDSSTRSLIFSDYSKIPAKNAGLVLGTSKFVKKGQLNLFFKYRMEAAAKLYHQGKVKHLILSGDNSTSNYNEPAEMKKELMIKGVPEQALTLDYAGLRTFDSMIRCRDVFNQDDFIIISQSFHDARAIFICQHYGIQAIGFAAKDVPWKYSFKTMIRESIARAKMVLDIYVLHSAPKYGSNGKE